jgi:uncharacterized protein (DUF1499 family)
MTAKYFLIVIAMILSMTTHTNAAEEKQLLLCPASPNCVSSQAIDAGHFIAPFKFTGNPDEVWTALKNALLTQSRTVITQDDNHALHATATSLVFRFVDDIDMIMDTEAKLIHIRSASRTGYGDFGVNRKRVEALRTQLQQARVIE